MRKRALVIAAATALISLAAVESASAVVITQTQTVSNGFTTCRTVRQTALGPLGSASQSARVCRSNFGGVGFGGGGLGLGGFGGGGFGGGSGGGLHINVHF
jgi:hypothetical protein